MEQKDLKKCTFVVACSTFFGRNGKNLQDFKKELDDLTAKDKADLIAMFPSVGFEIVQNVAAGV